MFDITVHAGPDVSDGFEEGDDQTKELLGAFVKRALSGIVLVNVENVSADEELHNHACSDGGGNTEFHDGSSVGSQDDSQPVEGVRTSVGNDSVKRDLTCNKVDQDNDTSPHGSAAERKNLLDGLVNLGNEVNDGSQEL